MDAAVCWALAAAVLVWGVPFLLLSTAIGWEVGQRLADRVPPRQDHLPPRLVRTLPLVIGLWVGAMNGLHAGVPEGVIAMGDTWAAAVQPGAPPRIAWPWRPPPPEAPPEPSVVSAGRAALATATWGEMAFWAGVKVTLGGLLQPLRAIWVIQTAARAEGVWSAQDRAAAWRRTWWRARPQLVAQAHAGVAAAAALSGLYLAGLALLGHVVVRLARQDLGLPPGTPARRPPRVPLVPPPAPEDETPLA